MAKRNFFGKPSKGVMMIASERRRQVREEQYSEETDQGRAGALAMAGAAYAYARGYQLQNANFLDGTCADRYLKDNKLWPFGADHYKPYTDMQDLVRAGALIAAAIDALLLERETPVAVAPTPEKRTRKQRKLDKQLEAIDTERLPDDGEDL